MCGRVMVTQVCQANVVQYLGVRPFTFFEKGVVGHVGFADPFDEKLAKVCPLRFLYLFPSTFH